MPGIWAGMCGRLLGVPIMWANPHTWLPGAQEDPELKPMFEQIQTGGMAALQKAMSDPVGVRR